MFGHDGVGGSSSRERMAAEGYVFGGSFSASGENIGLVSGFDDRVRAAERLHQNLVKSPWHRFNVFDGDFVEIGLGLAVGAFDNGEFSAASADVVTQDYAASAASHQRYVVGVVYEDRNASGGYDPGEGLSEVEIIPDNGPWIAVTSDSGGYALPADALSGQVTLRASGGASGVNASQTVVVGEASVKADFVVTPVFAIQLERTGDSLAARVVNPP